MYAKQINPSSMIKTIEIVSKLTATYCQPFLTLSKRDSSSMMYARVPTGLTADICNSRHSGYRVTTPCPVLWLHLFLSFISYLFLSLKLYISYGLYINIIVCTLSDLLNQIKNLHVFFVIM